MHQAWSTPHGPHHDQCEEYICFWNDESNNRYAKFGQAKDNIKIYQIKLSFLKYFVSKWLLLKITINNLIGSIAY